MAEQARQQIDMRDFLGVINNADKLDIPPGAAEEQVNLCSLKAGEMVTRGGMKLVQFDEE